jgi:hypothetical protein
MSVATDSIETKFKARAKEMALAMADAERWIYAIPLKVEAGRCFELVTAMLDEADIPKVARAAQAKVVRYFSESQKMGFVLFEHPDLGVLLLEADGAEVVGLMRRILETVGFIPQSALWQAAMRVEDTKQAREAVTALAHMVVAWDDAWQELFMLHLASPDAVVRHDAVLSTTMAAMVARDPLPALQLLDEAQARETYPKLSETIEQARTMLRASTGEAVDLSKFQVEMP